MKKLTTLTIDLIVKIVTQVFFSLGITFTNETYMSTREDSEFSSEDEMCSPWELVHDETENEIYDSQLTFPTVKMDDVVKSLTEKLGPPTEMRGERGKEKNQPVWKYGKDGKGQVWVYPHDKDKSFVDIRYYYTKV